MQNYIVIVSQRWAERASGSYKDPKKARGSLREIYLKLFSFDWSLSLFGFLWLFLTLSLSLSGFLWL